MKRKLDVLISTFGKAGIERVAKMNLPIVDGVTYIVSWQTAGANCNDIPLYIKREDILIYPSNTIGISINRNLAISHAEAPVCLTADDDLHYEPQQLQAVIKTFDSHPDVEVASFMYRGADTKPYPQIETSLSPKPPKNFWSSAIEIAFRTSAVKGIVKYDENFGPGEHMLQAGEDTVFFLDCLRAKLNCRFFPIFITSHPHQSTGHRPITNKGVIMADGAYIRKCYGIIGGLPRLPLCVWRNYRRKRLKFWWGLRYIISGFFLRLKY